MEIIGNSLKGIYRDVLMSGDGETIHDSGWVSNTIVESCRVLLAGFMCNDPSGAAGIHHLAVGSGLEVWDAAGPPPPDPEITVELEEPHDPPISVLDFAYLGDSDSAVTGPTNRLQITATLLPDYPPPLAPLSTYPLREFGLFGSFGGAFHMINCVRHPVIHKDDSATLIRVMRLYF